MSIPAAKSSPSIALTANDKVLSTAPNRLGRLSPTRPSIGIESLRQLYAAQGYLWLKGLLPRHEVIQFRGWVLSHLAESGLLKPGTDTSLGIASDGGFDRQLADRRLMALVRSTAYEGFCAQPRMSRLMDAFVGGLSYLHKRKIMRFTMPGTTTATPAHYDLVYLRGGTSRVVTAWIPLGDTPVDMGGLIYLEGSHAVGAAMEAQFARDNAGLSPEERISAYNRNMGEGGWVSKDLPATAERFDTRWLTADYEAGDVVLHSPYMIHASTTNQSAEGLIRLSTDIRYQNVDDEIDARWGSHWSLGDML
ncbi:phytanoyl-CoA dioxygenase family protein [Mesorhizobium sp. CU2]|uniref:phytanoyl-CoA dioxygenase family protein n=1 Tax=unclassified Mesorhizobium TaxID=325217 RepID=UPI00112660CB|nr:MULTISPECIES: phytanoyl-CoA dioxygenase family protein [unclassified Mesorhizobium]TPN77616.1 phytanoyl-CoA dioxygenase family protein [Mesorhizobium sp. CU3]TPO18414.1 phytanoyl-CoA dioxygenase family protein [Mesorhizobium sp. CU2]